MAPTDKRSTAEKSPPSAEPRLNGDLLATSLLAFLKSYNAYGYQLSQQLAGAGLPQFDSGTVYRTLRQLEKSGLVSSFWDTSANGPARRMYSLTQAGELFLGSWIETMQRYQAVLATALTGFAPADQQHATSEES